MNNWFGSIHVGAALHDALRDKVRDRHVRNAVRNVHRRLVGMFRRLRDVWRVTAGLSRRHGASAAGTSDSGPEQRRGIPSVDRRGDWAGPAAAAAGPRAAEGRRPRRRAAAVAGVRAADDLDELPTLEHEEQVGVALQKAWIQLVSQLDRVSKATGKN